MRRGLSGTVVGLVLALESQAGAAAGDLPDDADVRSIVLGGGGRVLMPNPNPDYAGLGWFAAGGMRFGRRAFGQVEVTLAYTPIPDHPLGELLLGGRLGWFPGRQNVVSPYAALHAGILTVDAAWPFELTVVGGSEFHIGRFFAFEAFIGASRCWHVCFDSGVGAKFILEIPRWIWGRPRNYGMVGP